MAEVRDSGEAQDLGLHRRPAPGGGGFSAGQASHDSHPNALKERAPYCEYVLAERVVDDGDVITAGGVSSSLDLGLHVVQRLAGPEARAIIAKQIDYPYRWKD